MPPLRLTSLLQTALPHVSEQGRALLSVLGCVNGHSPRSPEIASWLGFHDRYQLARALRRDGLPPLEVISGWARTLYWILESETSGLSLRELAERERLDPAIAYRLIRRVTGRRWSEVRRDGLATALLRFKDRCANGRGHGAGALPTPLVLAMGELAGRVHGRAMPARAPIGTWRSTPQRAAGHHVIQSISERVAVNGWPFDVALTPSGTALVTRPHAAAVDVLLLNPLRVGHTIRVGPGPTRVIASGNFAFVTSQFAEAVCVIDLDRRQQVGSIPMPGDALGAAMSTDGRTLYVTTNHDRLVAINTLQRTVIGSVTVPFACPQLTVHPSGRWIFVSCWREGVVAEVDATTLTVTRRFAVGGVAQDVVVSSDGQTLYAANESGWLDVIHLPSGRRTATVEFGTGTGALGVALSADQAHVFVGLLNAGRVIVLQRHGLIERASIATGGRPRLFAVHPDGSAVLVANEGGWVDLLR